MNGFFNFSIYKESMRQTKIFGIIVSAFFAVTSLLTSLNYLIDSNIFATNPEYEPYSLCITEFSPFLCLSFMLFLPLMAAMLMRYTTTKSGSDFYFSLPAKRGTLFFSMFTAVISWAVIIIFCAAVFPYAFGLIFNTFKFEYGTATVYLLKTLICCFYVISAVFLATSVSGTVISTLVIAVMIIFLPRFFIDSIFSISLSNNIVAEASGLPLILTPQINLAVGFITNFFDFTKGIMPIIYTACPTVIYLFLGYFLFRKRKSEGATNVVTTNLVKIIVRDIIAICINLLAVYLIVDSYTNELRIDVASVILILGTLIFSFGAFIIAELIATKNVKAMVKCMPKYLIVIVFSVIIALGCFAIRSSVPSFTPKPEEISKITYTGYFEKGEKQITVTDKEKIKVFAKNLKDNHLKTYDNFDFSDVTVVNGTIYGKFYTRQRTFIFTSKEFARIAE